MEVKIWLKFSPSSKGLHDIVNPERDDCKVSRIFRLNINKGEKYLLESKELEMNPLLIKGKVKIEGVLESELNSIQIDTQIQLLQH